MRLREAWRSEASLRPSLRFRDDGLERDFAASYYRDNITFVRITHVLGIASWAAFGLMALSMGIPGTEQDFILRFGVAVPLVVLSLVLTFTPWYERLWQPMLAATLLANAAIWSIHGAVVVGARADWGYAGLMIVLAFTYVLSRIRFVYVSAIGVVAIAFHNVVMVGFTQIDSTDLLVADYFLIVFAAIGMAAAFGLERFARLLFFRERELDLARHRADELLHRTLPTSIVDRLKVRGEAPDAGFIADSLPCVTVLFVDLVGFTAQTQRIEPSTLVTMLDDLFSSFDGIAARCGLEKIKTVGDAYMAVAGAPMARADHAEAAAAMALEVSILMGARRWPTDEPMSVRIGMATGPAVAGVIGRNKFAYDLWGDVVNLASRLESSAEPGRILVDDAAHAALARSHRFDAPVTLALKGKGTTRAWPLLGSQP